MTVQNQLRDHNILFRPPADVQVGTNVTYTHVLHGVKYGVKLFPLTPAKLNRNWLIHDV